MLTNFLVAIYTYILYYYCNEVVMHMYQTMKSVLMELMKKFKAKSESCGTVECMENVVKYVWYNLYYIFICKLHSYSVYIVAYLISFYAMFNIVFFCT